MDGKKLKTIVVKENVMNANDRVADGNRIKFQKSGMAVLNLISSPGSGKTTLLEATIRRLGPKYHIGVIEGDIQGSYDAERLSSLGIPVIQINTESACHLDAVMIQAGLESLPLKELDLIFIENVGNLVCPAEFDVGETAKVAMLSVPEGDDKPLKYPLVFREARLVLINKIDTLEGSDFDMERVETAIKQMNPDAEILKVSAKKGLGMDAWCKWIEHKIKETKTRK